MLANDRVLQLVQQSGPVVPSQISKEIGTDILIASAMLADLASQNKVKISSVKVGGSPLYYTDGQEDKLQRYVDKLPDMEQRAFRLLQENKILRDALVEPPIRYALRQIKDFAKPLEVTANGVKEVFWKWYLLPTSEAEPFIRRELSRPVPVREEARKPELRPEPKVQQEVPVQRPEPKQEIVRPVSELIPKVERKEPELKQVVAPEVKIAKVIKKSVKKADNQDSFLLKVDDFFKKNNIEIVEQNSRKKAEAEFVIKVPSAVGFLQYYCKVKNKKSCNEADLSEAYVQGQLRKLPTLFISSGELTKQAQALLNNDQINISFKKV